MVGVGRGISLLIPVERSMRLVGLALGEQHQVAIRNLATCAAVPMAVQEVGAAERPGGGPELVAMEVWEADEVGEARSGTILKITLRFQWGFMIPLFI